MRINVKLMLIINIIVELIGIASLTIVTLSISKKEISRLADQQAISLAREGAQELSNWFEEYMITTRTIALIMEAYQEIPITRRRDNFNLMLRQVLNTTPDLLAMYTNWAPNALDSLDAQYINAVGADETGRFIPSWDRFTGEVKVDSIKDFAWETVVQRSQSWEEYALDPAEYLTAKGSVLYADIGVPIRNKATGDLLGTVGASIELSPIQALVGQIKPFGDGQAFVFSANGIVVAHPDAARVGKNMRDTEADTFGESLDALLSALGTGSAVSFTHQVSASNTVMQYYTAPFSIGKARSPWTMVIGVSRDTIMAPISRMAMICLIIDLGLIVFCSVSMIFLARSSYYYDAPRGPFYETLF
jgi:methyl-accepting chemotaxis protein